MGWLRQERWNELRDEADSLTRAQRESLTWREARIYVPADTLAMAAFSGMERRKDVTPFQAVCKVLNMTPSEAKEVAGDE